MSCSMLLGWKHCRHHDHEEDEPIPPTQLANLLPDNLESLHLAFDHLHENRNGCRYVCDIVRGIVADAARLKALKRISITRHTQHRKCVVYRYCNLCQDHLSRSERVDMARMEDMVVQELLQGTGIEIDFKVGELFSRC